MLFLPHVMFLQVVLPFSPGAGSQSRCLSDPGPVFPQPQAPLALCSVPPCPWVKLPMPVPTLCSSDHRGKATACRGVGTALLEAQGFVTHPESAAILAVPMPAGGAAGEESCCSPDTCCRSTCRAHQHLQSLLSPLQQLLT